MKNTPLLSLLIALNAPCFAQEVEEQEGPKLDELGQLAGENPQEEMTKLFLEVEGRLDKIGDLLLDASAGDTSRLAEIGASGIDEILENLPNQPSGSGGSGIASLLRSSSSEGEQVLEGIDRILEIAQQQGGSCSKPGNGQGDGQSMPQQGQSKPGSRKTDGQEKPEESPEQKQGEKPDGNKKDDKPTPSRPANESPDQETQDPVQVVEGLERWGDLPVHLRDIFRAEGGRDMPAQYRDWIDSYYRRLNDRAGDR
ncbi:MAG: hypothetical protein GY711_24320 [bacterium]|nr:hypothetical protein [bacterium]